MTLNVRLYIRSLPLKLLKLKLLEASDVLHDLHFGGVGTTIRHRLALEVGAWPRVALPVSVAEQVYKYEK